MPHRTAVILVVALTDNLITERTPRLKALRDAGTLRTITPPLPAVTTTAQASMLTGLPPRDHGIVANGWYDRESAEVRFWKQSNHLVHGEKVWETARKRDPSVTCAKMFWWYNMYATADFSVTPRPIYCADGRKIPDCYSHPAELRDELQRDLGPFPLFKFWGPLASIESSAWIAEATRRVDEEHKPTLTLAYIPHLDYALQKHGPNTPQAHDAAAEVDTALTPLLDQLDSDGVRTIILSEYAIEPVTAPIHPNRALREAGYIQIRDERGHELLDPGASRAFAVADHQIAHVYVREPADLPAVKTLCAQLDGVERVLDREAQHNARIDHERAGDLVLVAAAHRWFTYYYWLDDSRAPDFARTVDIHRKPGYDPAELFFDPRLPAPKLSAAWRLAKKKLGFRALMDLIPLDASLVKGSHGRVETEHKPIIITPLTSGGGDIPAEGVRDVILDHLFEDAPSLP